MSKRELHRHALDDLDVVASRVLGGQKTKGGSAARLDAVHVASKTSGVGVDANFGGLAWAHVGELSLTEIRRDPYFERQNEHQGLAGRRIGSLGRGELGHSPL